jgi:hypothetical protein
MITLLIYIIIVLIVLALVIYALQYVTIAQPVKNIIILLCILVAVLIILRVLGIFGGPAVAPLSMIDGDSTVHMVHLS